MSRKVSLGSFHIVHDKDRAFDFQISSHISVTLFDRSGKHAVDRMIGYMGPGVAIRVSRQETGGQLSEQLTEKFSTSVAA